jgi:hypothetical protein
MKNKRLHRQAIMLLVVISLLLVAGRSRPVAAQPGGPSMLDPHLGVRQVVTGLDTPTSLAFLAQTIFWCWRRTPARSSE